MVNPESPTYKASERIGIIIGKIIRYALISSGFFILGGIFTKKSLKNKLTNKPLK